MNVTSEKILSNYEDKVSTIGFQLRVYLLKNLNKITEYADESANIIGFGYGSGYKEMICAIIPSKKGIKLGFYKGVELPDPKKLLAGSGKVHKYVEIKSAEDIISPALKQLLQEAILAYQKRKG